MFPGLRQTFLGLGHSLGKGCNNDLYLVNMCGILVKGAWAHALETSWAGARILRNLCQTVQGATVGNHKLKVYPQDNLQTYCKFLTYFLECWFSARGELILQGTFGYVFRHF